MVNRIEPRVLKGFRDFLPNDFKKREYVVSKIKEVFELWGFEPLETPSLEYLETFSGNIGEDEKMFFKFTDQGGREVALRYDQTIPTCRLIAGNLDKITFPFKRYQIQNVWRAEKPQKGRYREFLQCDADIFGLNNSEADAEMIALSIEVFRKLGFKKPIALINDRELYKNIPYKVIVAIDKLEKIGDTGVLEEIINKGFSKEQAEDYLNKAKNSQPNDSLKTIFTYLDAYKLKDFYKFSPTLARSFSYSTGAIWEIVDLDYKGGSLLGGERFDSLISKFSNQEISGVGFGLGFDRTLEAMTELNLLPNLLNSTKVLMTIFSKELLEDSLVLTQFLRNNQIAVDIYGKPTDPISKQLRYADRKQISYAIILGEEEKAKNVFILKNLATSEQKIFTKPEVLNFLKNA